jgi:hypothetical protein
MCEYFERDRLPLPRVRFPFSRSTRPTSRGEKSRHTTLTEAVSTLTETSLAYLKMKILSLLLNYHPQVRDDDFKRKAWWLTFFVKTFTDAVRKKWIAA